MSGEAGRRLVGVYRGVVQSSADPLGQGRVQVAIPTTGTSSQWAPVCRPEGGITPRSASAWVGATCIVAFEAGDPGQPVVLGFL